jgi:hypothetical protein
VLEYVTFPFLIDATSTYAKARCYHGIQGSMWKSFKIPEKHRKEQVLNEYGLLPISHYGLLQLCNYPTIISSLMMPDSCWAMKFGAEAAGHPLPFSTLKLCRTITQAVAHCLFVAPDWSLASLLNVIGSPSTLPASGALFSALMNRLRSGGQVQGIGTNCPLNPRQLPIWRTSGSVPLTTPNSGTSVSSTSGYRDQKSEDCDKIHTCNSSS